MARRRRRRGGSRPGTTTARDKMYLGAGAAAYGYLDNHVDLFNKVPTLGTSSAARQASHAVLLHLAARNTSGAFSKWCDLASVGATCVAGYKVGAAKLDMAALEGAGPHDASIEGLMGIDDDDED